MTNTAEKIVGSDGEAYSIEDSLADFIGQSANNFKRVDEETHLPSDLLKNYRASFQAGVKKMKAIKDWDQMKTAGQKMHRNRNKMIKDGKLDEYNFLNIVYKQCLKRFHTKAGLKGIEEFKLVIANAGRDIGRLRYWLFQEQGKMKKAGHSEMDIRVYWDVLNEKTAEQDEELFDF